MNSLNVQKCDPDASKKKALIQSCKKKVPLKVSSWCYTQTLSRKVRGSKSGHLRPFVEHSCVKLFEKIHIVLNALFVALWLVQAQLQVLQTHFKLFLSLQVEIQPHNFLDSTRVPSDVNVLNWHYHVFALMKQPHFIIPPAFLRFKLHDFSLKGLFFGNSLLFDLVDLGNYKEMATTHKGLTTGCGPLSKAAPAVWHLITPPPAFGWGPDTLRIAAPPVDCCTWELLPETWVSEPAPGSLAAGFPSACTHRLS